jgi:hypothetical protein
MKNLTVQKIIEVVAALTKGKYSKEYSDKDISKIVDLSLECLNAIFENSRVDFKIIYDFWDDFTVIVKSTTKIVNNQLLTFQCNISFTDDNVEINALNKLIVEDKCVKSTSFDKVYNILDYLLNE